MSLGPAQVLMEKGFQMAPLVAFTERDRGEMRNLLGPWKQGQPKLKMCSDLYRGQGIVVSPSWTPQPTIKATQVCFSYNHIIKRGGS